MNKRRLQRKAVSDATAEIFASGGAIEGVVRNVSHTGIEILLASETLDPNTAKLILQLSYDGRIYRIGAIPRWQSQDTEGNLVGLRIYNAPHNWFELVDLLPYSVSEKSRFGAGLGWQHEVDSHDPAGLGS